MEPSATTPLLAPEPAADYEEDDPLPTAAAARAAAAASTGGGEGDPPSYPTSSMPVDRDAPFAIAVRTSDGITHPVSVTSASTIADVKKAVLGAITAPSDATFRLIAAGRVCPDDATLLALNVQVCIARAV